MFLSIIIPIYNEENSIIDVLGKLTRLKFPSFVEKKEIIVVDDFSSDDSLTKIKNFIPDNEDISLYIHQTNRGKGAAVRTGLENAKGDVYLIQDADLELDPEDIPRMLNAMKDLNVEFVNGSRFLPGIDRPLHSYRRYLGNRFFTFLTSLIVNVKLTDMACGYKLIKKNLLYNFILREDRFGFESELIIKALRVKRNNVAEIPVNYFPRNEGEGKKFKNLDAIKILWVIIKYGLLRLN
ncbi:MAG: glycosyltransferase family 2 protein [Bacteroidales bacterium]|nr:glycosyltransferase family 2 protein [Bacteroidales bacterium]